MLLEQNERRYPDMDQEEHSPMCAVVDCTEYGYYEREVDITTTKNILLNRKYYIYLCEDHKLEFDSYSR